AAAWLVGLAAEAGLIWATTSSGSPLPHEARMPLELTVWVETPSDSVPPPPFGMAEAPEHAAPELPHAAGLPASVLPTVLGAMLGTLGPWLLAYAVIPVVLVVLTVRWARARRLAPPGAPAAA
ncbi:MAG: hypothetical protein ACREOF_12235, partial [Gemmatimonadales bacterium]